MNTLRGVYLLSLCVSVSLLAACGSSGGSDEDNDTTPPTATALPGSGGVLAAADGAVTITFSESMNPASLVLGGSLAPLSDGGVWSAVATANDTLTVSPATEWDTGTGTMTVDAADPSGNALATLDLSYAIPLLLSTFQAADVVIGQADFSGQAPNQGGAVGANTVGFTVGAPSRGSLYLADQMNNRILGFNTIPTTSNANADFVIGQADFSGDAGGTAASAFSNPVYTATAEGRLFVSDFDNQRVLIWNSLPTGNTPADVVVGASDFTTPGAGGASQTTFDRPIGIAVAGQRLFVTDPENNRVLIWNAIPTVNGAPADVVLGQANFTDNASGVSASALSQPGGVWSDGTHVAVADTGNNRVLIWNALPTTNSAPADVVIGQPDFNSSTPAAGAQGLNRPFGVHSNGLQLFVSDNGNNRLLVYDELPTSNQPSADLVIGQSTFTNVAPDDDDQDGSQDAAPSARTLALPIGVTTIGNNLFVASNANSRVLIYRGQ